MSHTESITTRTAKGTSKPETAAEEGQSPLGFDKIDRLPMVTGPIPELFAVAGKNACEMATAIYREGARGPAMRRLLARDITISRTQLRVAQSLRGIVLKAVAEGREDTHRLRTLERLVDAEHRRLMDSIDVLARLDSSPVVRVVAHQAVVMSAGGQQ